MRILKNPVLYFSALIAMSLPNVASAQAVCEGIPSCPTGTATVDTCEGKTNCEPSSMCGKTVYCVADADVVAECKGVAVCAAGTTKVESCDGKADCSKTELC